MMRLKLCILFAGTVFFLVSCGPGDEDAPAVKTDHNSIAYIKNAIRENPDSLMLKENLIEAYRNKGFYDSAISIADQEIKKDSGNAYLWNIKATLYFENNDTTGAIHSLERAIAIYPLPEYLVALGTVYAEIKNRNALIIAGELLRTAKSKSGKDAYFIRGLYYNYTGNPSEAISNLDSCLNLDYTYMYAYREKAIALYGQSRYEDALNVLRRAVTIQNNYDEGYFWMGKCYEKLNRTDDAVQSYQQALLYDRNYAEAQDALDRITGKGQRKTENE